MILDFLRTIQAQPIDGFSLDQFINEISSFKAPARGDFIFADLNLFRQNMISDLFSRLAYVRAFSVHAFVTDNAHSEIVNSDSMILSAHHLRS
jgi:hypothetical protein